jgi:predicted RNase H-like HicB family nuclease
MSKKIEEKARTFAELPYSIKISKDKTVDGGDVFIASHPELVGCMAQGDTVEEAVETLKEVTCEYIESLLEDRLPIPVPSSRLTTTVYIRTTISETVRGNKPFIDILSDVVQPSTREDISTVECLSC